MVTLMISFLAGLFVGSGTFEQIKDNLDLDAGFACPRATRGEFTVTGTPEFASSKTGQPYSWHSTPTPPIPGHLRPRTCYRTARPENHPANVRR